jgi:DNA helicase-4
MKVGDYARHVGRPDESPYGEITELSSEGRCTVVYPDGTTYSWIPLTSVESVEAGLERQRRQQAEMLAKQAGMLAKQQVMNLLNSGEFDAATKLYNIKCTDWWPFLDFKAYRTNCMKAAAAQEVEQKALFEAQRRQRITSEVEILLNSSKYSEADHLHAEQCQDWWPLAEYESMKQGARFVQRFVELYRGGSLKELDQFYRSCQTSVDIPVQDYVTLKVPKVDAILRSMDITLDDEQVRAIAHPEDRLLITARAGSGKTRTLCAKAALSIHDEHLYADQVLILAFNKAAALTVKKRLKKGGQVKDYRNARTFHSLAYQLVKPRKKLLFDAGGEPSKREQSRFAQRMMQRILNPAFKEAMVEYFRRELEQIEDMGRDLPPDEYLTFRRSLEHVTLEGKRVKSNGEKFIADFLFEHGVEYRYEKPWAWKVDFLDGSVYKPDFSFFHDGRDFVLEHWAIDPEDTRVVVPSHWSTTTAQYRAQIVSKREFWLDKPVSFLETHTGMLRYGRADFENQLKEILQTQGIQCQRLPQEEIVRRVFATDFQISRMAELFLQFIQRAKKMGSSFESLAHVIAKTPDPEPRARLFHQLAMRAYREYEAMLVEEGAMDFDDLLAQAADEVMARGPSLSIHLGDGKMLPLKELRWVLLDEYQDFSELYFRMLDAILKVNPKIKLVAVGDDWQAINAFAGADLRFFKRFASYFPESSAVGVTTNHRSDSLVVNAGNRLMAGKGPSAKCGSGSPGIIQILNVNDEWIEFREGNQYQQARESDAVFLPSSNDGKRPSPSLEKCAKAVKLCSQQISELLPEMNKPNTRAGCVMLLARTGRVYGMELEDFRQLLISALVKKSQLSKETLENNISVSTAHGSKGQEAHTVFILDATQRQFPKIHPDNLLFRPFGVKPKAVLDEERRLFYVAITRAEHRLYVLTEKGEESPYLFAFKVGRFFDHVIDDASELAKLFDFSTDDDVELTTYKEGSLAGKIAHLLDTCLTGEMTTDGMPQEIIYHDVKLPQI